ncbi:helix-turn-helix domain-containing protein [Aestuariibius sp. 2305UL40-4]|uniref:helix-turn-helix domain-containing protein n=1 Tax=Aestuariibius violaceus TaxID=3234132 RepID=UPI00345E97D5
MTQCTASSLAEFYSDPSSPYAAFPQEHRDGGSMPVTLLRAEQQPFEGTDPAVPELGLILATRADMPFRWNVGDGLTDEKTSRSGDLSVVPAQTAIDFYCYGEHELIDIRLPAGEIEALVEDYGAGRLSDLNSLTGATLFRDETLRRTVMQMWAESARTGGTSDLLMDGLTQVLIARLFDKAGALRRPQPILPLSPAEITRIDTLVEHRLAERLTVADLARALDMPRWIFADAFKATTGDTPHAYVTGKRLDKACELLRLGDMPLAEIAYATGFASQSHMTDTFRRILGTTPGKWRREVRQ